MAGCSVSRKTIVVTVTILLSLVTSFSGCGGREATNIARVGFLRNDLHQLAYYVAREKGFYSDEGLDVREGGAFSAGPEEMSAFCAGELDVGYVGLSPALIFSAQDMADIRIVAQVNQDGSALVVRGGLEGQDMAALNGRTVAIPGYSTVQDFLLRMALSEAGMEQSDVSIVALQSEEMIPAMKSGGIDAFLTWEPYPSQAVMEQVGRVLLSSRDIWPGHPCCVLVVDEGYLASEPEAVQMAVDAHVKATDYINQNRLEAVDMAHLFTGEDREVAGAAMENVVFDYRPDESQIILYAEFLKENQVLNVDNPGSFVRGLLDKRFIPPEEG